MQRRAFSGLMLAGATLALSACGGGGGGGIESMPPAPITTPTPPPSDKPLPPDKIGLVSPAPFAVLAESETYLGNVLGGVDSTVSDFAPKDVQFSYDAANNVYMISLPDFVPGNLVNTTYGGSAGQVATESRSQVSVGFSTARQPVYVTLQVPGSTNSPYTYTSWGTWNSESAATPTGQFVITEGTLVYGIPTPSGGVPVTGSAGYTAQIHGSFGPGSIGWIEGTAKLQFDFGQGKLSGWMDAGISQMMDAPISLGRFDFTNTVYARGSTTFSGQFIVPGLPNADSSFSGNFTGPNANEVMARFQTPYLLNGQQGTIAGIWIGRRN